MTITPWSLQNRAPCGRATKEKLETARSATMTSTTGGCQRGWRCSTLAKPRSSLLPLDIFIQFQSQSIAASIHGERGKMLNMHLPRGPCSQSLSPRALPRTSCRVRASGAATDSPYSTPSPLQWARTRGLAAWCPPLNPLWEAAGGRGGWRARRQLLLQTPARTVRT